MFLIFIIYLNLYGYKTATYFDEKLFNIGAQLADNHSDLYDYCKSTNQSSCYQLMTGRKATFLEYFYPNPLEFAENARNYECPKGNAIGFMYYPTGEENDDYWIMEGFVNKELLADWKSVAYTEREKECPKIAWGFAAVYLINLRYDRAQDDYVELKERDIFIRDYYCKYLKMYLDNHNGLRYSKLSTEQKELDFIAEHEVIIRGLWERSTPLTKYPVLFEYAKNAEKDYETYLANRKKEIQKKVIEPGAIFDEKNSKNRTIIQNGDKSLYVENNNGTIIIGTDMHKRMNFSTEIRETFGKQYVKVYFLDDSIAKDAKEVVERLNVIKTVNITPSASKDHPGNTLTVYPKSMVEAEDCEKEMVEALNRFFSRGILADKKPVRNDAYFNDIADKIIKDLDKARVSIHVCMAWFTNQSIADKLVEKHKQGIDVKVIFYDDHTNSKFGVNIDGIPFKAVRGSRGGIMHNKYCIIDNQVVITGSYNWSKNAEDKNEENAAVMYDYDRASDYSVEFRKMFDSE